MFRKAYQEELACLHLGEDKKHEILQTLLERPQRHVPTKGWLAAAAAAVLILGVVTLPILLQSSAPQQAFVPENLPILMLPQRLEDNMGFEGFLEYEANELSDDGPWQEGDIIKTLPVFQNTALEGGYSQQELTGRITEIAARIALTVDSLKTEPSQEEQDAYNEKMELAGMDNSPPLTMTTVEADCNGVKITAYPDGTVCIQLEEGFPLLEDTQAITNDVFAQEVLEKLIEEYKALMGYEKPQPSVKGYYTYGGERLYEFYAYEGAGDLTQQIVNYTFQNIRFGLNDENKLSVIWLADYDLSQKLGDYPLISENEAKEMLVRGNYLTTVPEAFPGEKYISKVELGYRVHGEDEVFIPYYKFYVELPSMQLENGLKTYGVYYVPAVQHQYLTALPEPQIHFN